MRKPSGLTHDAPASGGGFHVCAALIGLGVSVPILAQIAHVLLTS